MDGSQLRARPQAMTVAQIAMLLGFAFVGLVNGFFLGLIIGGVIGASQIKKQQALEDKADRELFERLRNEWDNGTAA